MAQTLSQIQKQIAKLQQDEQRLQKESAEVIAKIKVAIRAYGFTPQDLFGDPSAAGASSNGDLRVAAGRFGLKLKSGQSAKFADGNGNEWGGRGPRPIWLRTALAEGRTLSEFAVQSGTKQTGRAVRRGNGATGGQVTGPLDDAGGREKRTVAIKYRDGNNAWSGRGSQPRWLRSALAEGRSLEEFAV